MPAAENELIIHAWHDCGVESLDAITPMVWVSPERRRPEDQAKNAAVKLRKTAPGRRCLHIFQPLKFPDERPVFDVEQPVKTLRAGAKAGEGLAAWYRAFFAALAREPGAVIDRIVLDYEKGISFWHLGSGAKRTDRMRQILSDPIARRVIPEEVGEEGAQVFSNTRRARNQIKAFNRWADLERARVLYETIVQPARRLLGNGFVASNYNDVDPSFPIFDMNGWPRERQLAGGATGSSSPELYLLPHGNRYRNTSKAARWNRFADCISMARACSNGSTDLVPWISLPHYSRLHDGWNADPFLWQALISHLIQMGVREFILWNPDSKPAAAWYTAQAEAVFSALEHSLPGEVAEFQNRPVPLDTSEIETGDVRTTYADFLDHSAPVEPGG